MARADRLERMDLLRSELEAEYRTALIDALQITAAGTWGLFGHSKDKHMTAAAAPAVEHLCDLGQSINELREKLDMPDFDLHEEFEASRGPVSASAVGEPRQAKAWLDRLARKDS
jgi:hypothetical protein